MPQGREPDSEPTSEEERLAVLLADFERRRRADASAGIDAMRESAGELLPKLSILAECLGLFDESTDATPEAELPPWIGPYRILERIGAGATSVVYRAEDPTTGRVVAVKVMRKAMSRIGSAPERFRRESRAAQRLDHPHIVKILGSGEFRESQYLVMELVDGVSLAHLLDEIEETGEAGPSDSWLAVLDSHGVGPSREGATGAASSYARRMASLFAPLGGALDAAAEAGLVHRDVKPGNLLLDAEGRLRISDFGLVKMRDETMTSVFAILGTPAYMSPEQATGRSREADIRSDLYGVGASLYHVLTLDTPVRAKSYTGLMAQIAAKRPDSVRAACPEYPRSIARIVARCLEKDPRDRYPDGRSLQSDLERVSESRKPLCATPSAHRRARRFLASNRRPVAATLAILALVAAGVFWLTRPGTVEITTIPEGRIVLDGEPRGEGSYAGRISSGVHELVVTRARFRLHEESIDLGAGERRRLSVNLEPEDPFDTIALKEILKAHGVECPLPEAEPVRYRSPVPQLEQPWTDKVTLATPRGSVPQGILILLLHATEALPGLTWRILDAAGGEVLHEGAIPAGAGLLRVELPELPSAGRGYRILIARAGEEGSLQAAFDPVDATPVAAWRTGPPHARALASACLLDEGYAADSLLVAVGLAEDHPDRSMPWRLAVEALQRLGLGGRSLYQESVRRFQDAEAREGESHD